jgi:hypothetical protein
MASAFYQGRRRERCVKRLFRCIFLTLCVILGLRQLAGLLDPSCFFKICDARTDMISVTHITVATYSVFVLMEEIWGENEITESVHHFDTLAKEGFRHGKLSRDDNNRQTGFNYGFNLGRAIGRSSGHFLAVLNHSKISKLVNENVKEILLSLSPDTIEENFEKLDNLLENSPELVIVAYYSFKADVRRVFLDFSHPSLM